MPNPSSTPPDDYESPSIEEEASALFIQRLYGEWGPSDQSVFEARLATDRDFAHAFRNVEDSWRALDTHAEAPELMKYRAQGIESARRANARRWFRPARAVRLSQPAAIAASIAGVVFLVALWQLSPFDFGHGEYRTSIGEQRIIELPDHTRITLDAATRLKVRFTNDTRKVQLLAGQAEFSVAKDPSRPFKVTAGRRTIVAVGTVFNVDCVDSGVRVDMIEGKVAVLKARATTLQTAPVAKSGEAPDVSSPEQSDARYVTPQEGVEEFLTGGQELRVANDGIAVVIPRADLESATAWRQGKVIFRKELLLEAVARMNRYSKLQVHIDDHALAEKKISGVFEAGDTRGFVAALQTYFDVAADFSSPGIVELRPR